MAQLKAEGLPLPVLALALATIVALFFGSATLLYDLKYYYVEGGAAWQKIHPSSYLALLSFAGLLASTDVSQLVAVRRFSLRLLAYFSMCVVLLLYCALYLKFPVSYPIDNFLTPGLLLVVLSQMSERQTVLMRRLVVVLFGINGAIAILEYVTGNFVTTPMSLIATGEIYEDEWRVQSLFGHPLFNGELIGILVVSMLCAARRERLSAVELAVMGICVVALPFFGARTATSLLGVFTAGFAIDRVVRVVRSGGVTALGAAGFFASSFLVCLAVAGILDSGVLDRFLDRFQNDSGSATSRLIALEIFKSVSLDHFLFGDIHGIVADLQRSYGIIAIEISWLSILLQYGMLLTLAMFVSVVSLLWTTLQLGSRMLLPAVLYFFMVDIAANGISGKTQVLSCLIVIVLSFSARSRGEDIR